MTESGNSVTASYGDSTFVEFDNYVIDSIWIDTISIADIDLDGNLDLISGYRIEGGGYEEEDYFLGVSLGNGDGTFEQPINQELDDEVISITIEDIDDDGNQDVITTNYFSDSISILNGNGDGTLSFQSNFSFTSDVDSLALKDINGDGKLEMAIVSTSQNQIVVIKGNENGTFTRLSTYSLPEGSRPINVAFADLNGDGRLDLVTNYLGGNPTVPDIANNSIIVWLGDGEGSFNSLNHFEVGNSFADFLLVDVNTDGDFDIITVNPNDYNISVLINQQNGEFNERFYTYEPVFNQLTSYTDEIGRVTLYEIDSDNGNVVSTTRVVGELDAPSNGETDDVMTRYAYTNAGLIDKMTDANGQITDYNYHLDTGNLIEIIYAVGTSEEAIVKYEYDTAGNQIVYIDENNNRTEYEYDNANRLIETRYAVGSASDEAVEMMDYDDNGNLIIMTDGLGNVTEYVYDTQDRLIKVIEADPDGAGPLSNPVTINTYDGNGNLVSTIDPLNRETRYIYDSRNRLVEIIQPDGNTTEAHYDNNNNNLVSTTDQTGNLTTNIYDYRDRLIREIDAEGNETKYEYDRANQLIALIDGNDNRTEFEYDDLGRQIKVTDGEGNITRYEYDKVGNVTATIDGNGNRTEYEYDARNRQILMRNVIDGGDDIITTTTYDDVGNVLSVTDSVNNQTSYTYDARNRVITETNELSLSRTFAYDEANNLTRTIDRNDRVRAFSYDNLNRQIEEIWLDDNSLPIYSTTSSYNAGNELIFITNPDATYNYTYDVMGRIETVDNANTPDVPNVVLTYNYDEQGNIISVSDSINGIDSGITTYDYDRLNRLTSLTQSGNGVEDKRVDFDYNGVGQYERIDRYSDLTDTNLLVSSSYDYDGANRLTNLIHNNGINDVAFYDLTYDAGSRITQIIDVDSTNTFAYDTRDQLLNATHSDIDNDDEIYSYDDNGNRTLTDYDTGVNNELLSDGVYNYDYDNEGNLISQTTIATGEVRLFEWDYLDRLVAVTDFDSDNDVIQTVEFSYDMFGQRLSKVVDGVATYFVYDREDVILDFVDDGSGVELDMRYLHGAGIDEVLAQEDSDGNVTWFLTDHLGTIRDLVDNSGDVVNHLTYDSYGNVVSETNATVDSRYRFTGREWDEEIELYYYRARYYNGETGRFISVDPISFDSGTYNLYGYVDNNPVNAIDPSGQNKQHFKVELVYINLSGGLKHHAEILITDMLGSRGFIGEPEQGGSLQVSNTLSSSGSAGGSFGFGKVIMQEDIPYSKSSQIAQRQIVYEEDCLKYAPSILSKTKAYSQIITNSDINYNPFLKNSNSAAFTILELALPQLLRPFPKVGIDPPAWEIDIFTGVKSKNIGTSIYP